MLLEIFSLFDTNHNVFKLYLMNFEKKIEQLLNGLYSYLFWPYIIIYGIHLAEIFCASK